MRKDHNSNRSLPWVIEVTVPPGSTGPYSQAGEYTLPPARPGGAPVRLRVRVAELPPEDRIVINGLPCTSIIRTLIDLSEDETEAQMVSLLRDALARGLVTDEELTIAAIERTDLAGIDGFRRVLRALRAGGRA